MYERFLNLIAMALEGMAYDWQIRFDNLPDLAKSQMYARIEVFKFPDGAWGWIGEFNYISRGQITSERLREPYSYYLI